MFEAACFQRPGPFGGRRCIFEIRDSRVLALKAPASAGAFRLVEPKHLPLHESVVPAFVAGFDPMHRTQP